MHKADRSPCRRSHRPELELVANTLLEYETLDADDVGAIVKGDVAAVHRKFSQNNVERQQKQTTTTLAPGDDEASVRPVAGPEKPRAPPTSDRLVQ